MKLRNLLPKARVIWIVTKLVGHLLKVKEIRDATPRVDEALDALRRETDA